MSRALPPLKGHLRKKVQPKPSTPALPENPYKLSLIHISEPTRPY